MASLKLVKSALKARPIWLYPRVVGLNPSERWGHSACFADGILYVFGGCCGGLHFSDVLTLDLKRMAWSCLVTTGQQPGTRDSHTAVLFGQRMIIFGGTNGSKKINDLHILDLKTRDWTRPSVEGRPPARRESHSATLWDDNKLIIFGGSGEGEGNYMNDVHILDLNSMRWTSPEVKGELPACRDSHTAVAVGNRLVVYGGDCGDHYLGEVDVLDLGTFTWSRLEFDASASPGVRAGHASVAIGNKVYIVGGVGDRAYYNDVWTLDMSTCVWAQLDVGGPQPQGRFSHSAVLADCNIVIYGGCGEDEHPLDEIILLHLGSDHSNGSVFSLGNVFGNPSSMEHWKLSGHRRILAEATNEDEIGHASHSNIGNSGRDPTTTNPFKERITAAGVRTWKEDMIQGMNTRSELEAESKPCPTGADNVIAKRRKVSPFKDFDLESEQEEHSHSVSQQSSPSQSDQEQTAKKRNNMTFTQPAPPMGLFLQQQPGNPEIQTKQRVHPYMHHFQLHPHNVNFGASQVRLEFPQQNQEQKGQNVPLAPSLQLKMRLPHLPASLSVNGGSQHPQIQLPAHDYNTNIPDAASRNSHGARVENLASGDKQQRVAVTGILAVPSLVGSEVRGTVDAVFDSGYLMTAQVNGQIFRGLLFNPGPALTIRDEKMCTAINSSGDNHVNPNYVISHHPHVLPHPHSAQYNPGWMNGTILGTPMLPGVHLGTATQPAHWSRTNPASLVSENRTEASVPHLGLMLRPPAQKSSDIARQMIGMQKIQRQGSDILSKTLGARKGSGDEVQSALPHLRVGCEVEDSSHTAPAFSGPGGHWVWHPGSAPAPIAGIVPVDESIASSCRNNVHFVAVPPFPGFGFAPQFNHDIQASVVQGRPAQASSNPDNGASSDLQAGVTLSLAGPGQTSNAQT